MWSDSDIINHPAYDLTIEQLRKQREFIKECNAKVDDPEFKFYTKKVSLEGVDRFINHKIKHQGVQLKLF